MMVLQMYISEKMVESLVLTRTKMADMKEREWFVQGAINELLAKWGDVINDQHLKADFFIKGEFML
jgi:hypothetical protein